ncbi:hypothetical protein [Acidisoma silvae]|uniref:Uncharacterized protein n=1 Tax=Acidisoma silvae TaxID=2802396 RepID=A0A963YWH7_9PROT|nr:hypothetical protein [Acidisoma silvae]MCB8878436.1 hypothetical protein [Acidisoma silvae]
MAHGSVQKRRDMALKSLVSDLDGFELDATCGSCRRETTFPVSDLIPRFGTQTLATVTARLRCRLPDCGGKPAQLTLRRGGYLIPLIGPGSWD